MWIKEMISDSAGQVSSKRTAMLLAASSMSIAVILLSVAAMIGRDVAVALGAVSVPLAGLGGYSYVQGKRLGEN